jgi:hypothetical protein
LADREEAYDGFVKDLQVASALLTSGHEPARPA